MKEGVLMTGNAMKHGAKKTGEIITHAKEKLTKQSSNTETLIEVTEQTSVCFCLIQTNNNKRSHL